MLSEVDLGRYVSEYGLWGRAIARAASAVAAAVPADLVGVGTYAHEKSAQVRLWDHVVEELHVNPARAPLPETQRCVSSWSQLADDDVVLAVTVLLVSESTQAATAATLISDLERLGGAKPPALATYLARQVSGADTRIDMLRRLLGTSMSSETMDRAVNAAEATLSAGWELLCAVDRRDQGAAVGPSLPRGCIDDGVHA